MVRWSADKDSTAIIDSTSLSISPLELTDELRRHVALFASTDFIPVSYRSLCIDMFRLLIDENNAFVERYWYAFHVILYNSVLNNYKPIYFSNYISLNEALAYLGF